MTRRLLCVACLLLPAVPSRAEPAAAPAIRIHRDTGKGLWGLETSNARLGDIARALARSMACEITVDAVAAERRLSTFIAPRTPERLVPLLGRRANVSATLVYRFDKPGVGEAPSSPPGFGKALLELALSEPLEMEEALRSLRLPAELGAGVQGRVRLNASRVPVSRALDQIASQTGSKWSVVIRLKARTAADEIAAREDEPRFLYSDLAQLTPDERREEIAGDLEFLAGLPEAERSEAVKALAGNLVGMTSIVRDAQENRPTVAGQVVSIAQDYGLALRRLPADNRAWAMPLSDALRELSLQLRTLQ